MLLHKEERFPLVGRKEIRELNNTLLLLCIIIEISINHHINHHWYRVMRQHHQHPKDEINDGCYERLSVPIRTTPRAKQCPRAKAQVRVERAKTKVATH